MSTKKSLKLKEFAAVGLLAGALAGAASVALGASGDPGRGAVEAFGQAPPPASMEPYGSGYDKIGPGLNANDAVTAVLSGVKETPVRFAKLVPAPADSPTRANFVSVGIDDGQGDDPKVLWLGQIVQGAVADLMRTDQIVTSQVVGGGQYVEANGSGKPVSLGTGSAVAGQRFDSPGDEILAGRVRSVADRFGLKVRSIQVVHPLESALIIELTVPPGEINWSVSDLREAITGTPASVEGYYLEFQDPAGDRLLAISSAYRVAGGQTWFAPGQGVRFGVADHAMPGPDAAKVG